ncbi:MAG: acyl-CoA dehydrogenase family protein [Actinomycetota bacterium]|nr:acyl-CoA dehydrogenase family protein [Actinomycetota bacterium]
MKTREEQVRREARAWYEAHWDPALPAGEWFRMMLEARWAYAGWPEAWWGRGLPTPLVRVVREERRRVGALGPPSGIAPTLLAPMLFEHGTADQCRRFLRGMADGSETACQMLSEPDAGSDLAGVRTRAERDGDEWVITGSKTWTSNAELVDYGMLLARTDWDVPKHAGLTFFLVRRDQPGVEVQPLRQMTGDARFNQVFFDGARVSADDVLGPIGSGWAVTRTFLAHEKNSYNPAAHEGGPFGPVNLQRPAGDVLAAEQRRLPANASGRGVGRVLDQLVRDFGRSEDPLVRQAHAELQIRRRTMGYTNQRVRSSGHAGGLPGAEGAISKLTVSEITRGQRELGLAVQGAAGMLMGDDAPSGQFQYFAMGTPSISIAGGTDEIQRNHLGERILGLPAEPRSEAAPLPLPVNDASPSR